MLCFILCKVKKEERRFMNKNVMIQTLRRFKVTSGYKGYYYLLDAVNIIGEFHAKEKPFGTQKDIYIPIGGKTQN